jgi:hypothetical protein
MKEKAAKVAEIGGADQEDPGEREVEAGLRAVKDAEKPIEKQIFKTYYQLKAEDQTSCH